MHKNKKKKVNTVPSVQDSQNIIKQTECPASEILGLTATHDLLARKDGMHRRAFLHAMWGSATATMAILSDIGGTKSFIKEFFDIGADEQLLRQIYGVGVGGSAALVPAANHPWKRPPEGMSWYPTEEKCCEIFRSRFLKDYKLRTVTEYPQIKPDDSLYLYGSQVANLLTRALLGAPWQCEPILTVNTHEWSTELRWNLHSPSNAPLIERIQFGQFWQTLNHVIVDRRGQPFQPRAGVGWMEDDYMLMTVLPRFAKGQQRIFIFAGIHGPGTLAGGLLMANPPMAELRKMMKQTCGEPYFQALFKVAVQQNGQGEYIPVSMELVEAEALRVSFRQS